MAEDVAPTAGAILVEEDGVVSLSFEDGTVQSRVVLAESGRLVLEYTRLMAGFVLFRTEPARIAMIGLGGGALATYCARRLPEADFTAVEISPEVIGLREAFGVPPDGPRFRVLCEDGAEFVRRAGEPFDVLLVDGFDRGGQPEALCSAAFYDACRDRLAPGGVLVANLHSGDADHARRLDRLRDAFDGHVVVIDADDCENTVAFAGTETPFPPPFEVLVERLRALEPVHLVGLAGIVQKIARHGDRRPRRNRPR
jgi:spermidine synthase